MKRGLQSMAERSVEAEDKFIDYCRTHAGLSRNEALRVIRTYRKARVLRFDAVNGSFHVKHGAFLEKDILRKAAKP